MFDDEDYGFLTGGLGDLDGDGKVDFAEYLIEEDDFQRIMGVDDDGYPVLDDEDIDDLELDEITDDWTANIFFQRPAPTNYNNKTYYRKTRWINAKNNRMSDLTGIRLIFFINPLKTLSNFCI